ncbi:multicopper oxidase domain-containing protein [Ammoniphilus resinae]|uniref:Copper-containing nitrite reductase n=1 Tax=Ammoniphilus resinae TaxID=861532 RepID=A0ABS4GQH5_9BACL|nr:multicopper oxidase domain-containing protein [Ammoniphilus resinae]MBP1932397.1 nitrite reductase (NO-forming) [Ammoniphilus resinae]
MKPFAKATLALSLTTVLLTTGCGGVNPTEVVAPKAQAAADQQQAPEKINQAPIPMKMDRKGTDVFIEMTAQITNIQIDKNVTYNAWTFNGEAPGPLVVVNEGDTIHFNLKNMDPAVPHSMDFHAVHAAPSKKFIDVMPNEEGNFTYKASNPGVFMYHCGTKPVLAHIANGMHGVIIVKPKNGYPTDKQVDKEYVIIQNEWYREKDLDDMTNGQPSQVVFSTKALKEGMPNTNGDTFTLKEKPLLAKVGDTVRIYVNNVGPNRVSSFHVVGTVLDTVYLDGNPQNVLHGMQTVMLPASGGAVVEFKVVEAGDYTIVTHQFNDVQKGAAAVLRVTEDGLDHGGKTMSH